jgi:hypothetical protein
MKNRVTAAVVTIATLVGVVFIPLPGAAGEQIYKVRIGEISFNDYFQVGHKSFWYTERGYNSYYGANLILVPCSTTVETDCIDAVSYKVGNSSNWIPAELDSSWSFPIAGVPIMGANKGSNSDQFVIKNKFATPADPANNYPAGGATSMWKVKQASNSSNFRLFLNFNLVGDNPVSTSEKVNWNEFVAQVTPMLVDDRLASDGTPFGREQTFGEISDIKVRLKVKILKQILNGWVHSRTLNPEISYVNDVSLGEYVDISGGPLSVPTAEAQLTGPQYLSIYDDPYMKGLSQGYPIALPDPKVLWGQWGSTQGVDQGELRLWSAYEPYISKQAILERSMWKIVGQGNLNLKKFNSSECISDGKIDGILATNATQYSPTPPTYLESSQELSYQLAAPHFNTSNEEFKGTYSLVVSEKLAHCIWGKSLTNASARVTILSADGKSSVVTQSLKETSGFYYFNINGFGFSAPTIRIKLTQNVADAKPAPASIPSPVSTLASTFKVSITCTNGKVTKKVTGVSPKCPAGYKKK